MEVDGNQIATLSEAETARIHAAGAEVEAAWITEMAAQGLAPEALLADVRATVQATRDAQRDY